MLAKYNLEIPGAYPEKYPPKYIVYFIMYVLIFFNLNKNK